MQTVCAVSLPFQCNANWCNHILFVLMFWSNLCQSNICGISGDTTVIVLHRHEDVAIITPVGGPWVLYQPVWLPVEVAVPHREHSVVQVINGAAWESKNVSRGRRTFVQIWTNWNETHHKLVRSRRRSCRKQMSGVKRRCSPPPARS